MTKISIVAITFFLASCSDDKKKESTLASTCTSTETYATTGMSFIDDNCITCHGSATTDNKNVALDTLDNVKLNALKAAAAINVESMPMGSTLTADQKITWGNWFTCGSDLK